jgi:hypothetical protein
MDSVRSGPFGGLFRPGKGGREGWREGGKKENLAAWCDRANMDEKCGGRRGRFYDREVGSLAA